ncbi:hypothetical protein Ppa06_28940 [Planomonospora parontospora subsp. parontospora]|uniref:Uncharacterized protein n=2 Tax=Planomonospora parontospora TaxID=58119 RepID=A0AA37BGM8_9ACTN|nr:hypothetical protein [Planomonospora parontospora]GGK67934.1 hypothetical protein GCM10010126_29220 [Planomonospora parontospora]GII09096.1 hypothetical protein Ppa06_28940 [Planomonospora parontospora subsp. parontospora]
MTVTMDAPAATGAGGGVLERRYRRLLRGYPRDYRTEHGDEIISTLLETAEPGRTVPSARESLALLSGGLRTRVVSATRRPVWIDAVHLGVLAVSLTQLATLVPYATSVPLWTGLSALAVLLVMCGRVRLALPVTALIATKIGAVTLGRPWLDATLLPVYRDPLWDDGRGAALYGGGGPVAPMTGYALVILGLLVLAVRAPRPPARSWLWWAAVPALAAADPAGLDFSHGPGAPAAARITVELGLLCLAAWAGRVTRDPRWATAAGIHLVPVCAVYAENLGAHGVQDLAHLAALILLTALAAVAPHHARRHTPL